MILGLLTVLHVVVCLFLILVVLLQSGKAADLAGAFGGMGSQTAFGPRGSATLLSKLTEVSAVLFMVTSLTLAVMATRTSGVAGVSTVLERQVPKTSRPAPMPRTPGGMPVPGGVPSMSVTPKGGGPTTTVPIQLPPKTPANTVPAPKPAANPPGK